MTNQDVVVQEPPNVGDGATVCYVSDRYPATVIAVNNTRKIVVIQRDRYVVTGGSVLDGTAKYWIEPNHNGATEFVKQKRNGTWVSESGQVVAFGIRLVYRDPSF